MARRKAWGRGECGEGEDREDEGMGGGVRGEVTAPESILVMDIGAGTTRPGPCNTGAGKGEAGLVGAAEVMRRGQLGVAGSLECRWLGGKKI